MTGAVPWNWGAVPWNWGAVPWNWGAVPWNWARSPGTRARRELRHRLLGREAGLRRLEPRRLDRTGRGAPGSMSGSHAVGAGAWARPIPAEVTKPASAPSQFLVITAPEIRPVRRGSRAPMARTYAVSILLSAESLHELNPAEPEGAPKKGFDAPASARENDLRSPQRPLADHTKRAPRCRTPVSLPAAFAQPSGGPSLC